VNAATRDLLAAIFGGLADEPARAKRLTACEECEAEDSRGERLYRIVDGVIYCGAPRLASLRGILRDQQREGCGCRLLLKTRFRAAHCPRGQW
jgi:hypothetical protein